MGLEPLVFHEVWKLDLLTPELSQRLWVTKCPIYENLSTMVSITMFPWRRASPMTAENKAGLESVEDIENPQRPQDWTWIWNKPDKLPHTSGHLSELWTTRSARKPSTPGCTARQELWCNWSISESGVQKGGVQGKRKVLDLDKLVWQSSGGVVLLNLSEVCSSVTYGGQYVHLKNAWLVKV